jgi:hypothetical protein
VLHPDCVGRAIDLLRHDLLHVVHPDAVANEPHAALGRLRDLHLEANANVVCLWHEPLLSVDQPIELVEDAPRLDRLSFQPRAVDGEVLPKHRVVGAEEAADLVERDVQPAQATDRLGVARLSEGVVAVAARVVDARRLEQPDVVVMAQRLHRQTAEAGEAADGQLLGELHIGDRWASCYGRVKSGVAQGRRAQFGGRSRRNRSMFA